MPLKTIWVGLSLLLCVAASAGAGAWLNPWGGCNQACIDTIGGFMGQYLEDRAPVLATRPVGFEDAALGDDKLCPTRKQPGPAVFGVMLGSGKFEGFTQLSGPANVIRLISDVMRERGVAADFIFTAGEAKADRPGMLAVMAKALPCLRERGQLVLIYSGWGTVYPREWLSHHDFLKAFCASTTPRMVQYPCYGTAGANVPQPLLDDLRNVIEDAAARWARQVQPSANSLPGRRQHLLIGAASRADAEHTIELLEGITASDIANYVTRIRNRGADAFLIIDTRLAANGDLLAL